MTPEIAPLETKRWFARIQLIAAGGLGSLENALRHSCHLSQLTPVAFRWATNVTLDENTFEALLEAGDLDAAAHHLVPAGQLFVRQDEPANAAAWITCPVLDRTIEGTGEHIAAAVLDAWTKRILAAREAFRPGTRDALGPASPRSVAVPGSS